jgi:hypothetical protein
VKARETRRKVLLDARLRHERGWTNACILDVSSRGLMASASPAPAPGSYVVIGRGSQRIVARVVWANHDRFGARTQDALVLDAIAKGETLACDQPGSFEKERRSPHRDEAPAERHERHRRWGARLEFLAVVAFGCIAAFLVFDTMHAVFSKPLHLIEQGLRGRG